MKCKKKTSLNLPTISKTSKREMIKGFCSVCGTKVTVIPSKKLLEELRGEIG